MEKKGAEMAVNTVIMVILGLVVLVIIILVVRQQVTKGTSKYEEISEGIGLDVGNCFNIIEGRSCVEGSCPPTMESVSGRFPDCAKKEERTHRPHSCCKKKVS